MLANALEDSVKTVTFGMDTTTTEESSDHINVVVVGSRRVGKSSLVFRLATGTYNELYFPTTGFDHVKISVKDHYDEEVKLKIWDTSGDIRSREDIARQLYPLASGFILMYDVTSVQSYNDIFNWMRLIDQHASEDVKVVIVGNKTDIRHKPSDTHLTKSDGIDAAFCYGVKSMEVSVATSRNVAKMLRRIATICDTSELIKRIAQGELRRSILENLKM